MFDQNNTSPAARRAAIDRNHPIKTNTFIFCIVMIILQCGISAVYGTLIDIHNAQLKISSVVMMILLAILIVAGTNIISKDLA
jgi:quinol-cytochrome oxidoreductase complex cytochrome b subunit